MSVDLAMAVCMLGLGGIGYYAGYYRGRRVEFDLWLSVVAWMDLCEECLARANYRLAVDETRADSTEVVH